MRGTIFSAKRIDLAEYSTVFTNPKVIRFTGHKADGSTVTTSFTSDGVIDGTGVAVDFQTFSFPSSFSNLTRIDINDKAFSMDNIVFEVDAVQEPPPEPDANSLVLWNRLGSETEVRNSAAGSNGYAVAGAFVPGVFGNALEVSALDQLGVRFPLDVVPRERGCVEFWARVTGIGDSLPSGPRVTLLGFPSLAGDTVYQMVAFNGNDGAGNGGLCGRLHGIGSIGTGGAGIWTYSSALKGASVTNWHHYALTWDLDHVPGMTNPVRRMAVYVDGALNTGNWGSMVPSPYPLDLPQGGDLSLIYLTGLPAGVRAAVDNLKVWNYAKTDFSDRFDEGPGIANRTLTVSGTRGAGAPADGAHVFAHGATVDATVASPVVDGGTRHLCTGAEVTGCAFTLNSDTNVTFNLTNDAALAWTWRTQHRLALAVQGQGSVTPDAEWHDAGEVVLLTAVPAPGWRWTGWLGDTGGCTADGATLAVPVSRPRALTALFSDDASTPPEHLVFWNRLGSEQELLDSAIGPDSLSFAGSFVTGPFGGALELSSQGQNGAAFPIDVMPRNAGCLEFWAKADGLNAALPWGNGLLLAAMTDAAGTVYPILHFNGNDGAANGGLCARLGGIGSAGTAMFGSWTYTAALKGASVADWHHYALVWSVEAVPGFTAPVRRVAVFVDGVLNTGSWSGAVVPPYPLPLPEGGSLVLLHQTGAAAGRVCMDNVKLWSIAKTDFSDRFDEGPGIVNRTLTVSGTRGAGAPADGAHVFAHGAAVDATVASPVVDGGTRHLCTGAEVTGCAFALNSDTNVTFNLTNDAALAWTWQTQHRLALAVQGQGSVTPAAEWHDAGEVVLLAAAPAEGWFFGGWSGDTGGCAADGATLAVPVSRPRALTALFIAREVMSLADYARLPANAPFGLRALSGAWWYANDVDGLFCDSPAPRGKAAFTATLAGPGILSFDWELLGADGVNALACGVGNRARLTKVSGPSEPATVALAAGRQRVAWTVARGGGSPEASGVIRNLVWTPLEPAAGPTPADGATLPRRAFAGLAWNGAADRYRVYAGLSPASLRAALATTDQAALPADALDALLASAQGRPLYWRVDAVRVDSAGAEAVRAGPVWSLTVLPEGAPELPAGTALQEELTVGVRAELGPVPVVSGLAGVPQAKLVSGRLPPGIRLDLRDGALWLTGTPTRPGTYAADVQFHLRNQGQIVYGQTLSLALEVLALDLAAGTFDGWAEGSRYGAGAARLTVSPQGGVSGKLGLNGTNYTFQASGFDALSNGWCTLRTVVKNGSRAAFPLWLAVTRDGAAAAGLADEPEASLALARTDWNAPEARAALEPLAGVYAFALPDGGAATLTVSRNGSARFAGRTAQNKSFSSSGALLRVADAAGERYLAVLSATTARAARRYEGLFGVLEVVPSTEPGAPNTLAEVIPVRAW